MDDNLTTTRIIEAQEVYDGWSIIELNDGTVMNRWSDFHRGPLVAEPGYERRYNATERIIDANNWVRSRLSWEEATHLKILLKGEV